MHEALFKLLSPRLTCFIRLLVFVMLILGVQMVRYGNYNDLYLHKFDKDGEIKQLMYSEQVVEKSSPVLCFVHADSKACVMLSCNKLQSKLDLPSSHQRIFPIFQSTHLCFVGHKPDWCILKNDLINFVISMTRIQSEEILSTSIAHYLSEIISHKILSGLLKNHVEGDLEEQDENNRRHKSTKRIPIGRIMNRPLAANAIFPNVQRVPTQDSLYFWRVNTGGKCQKSRSFALGKVNPVLWEKMEGINESPSVSLVSTIESLITSIDEYDLVELAIVFPESRRSLHVLPSTKDELIQQLRNKLDFSIPL